MLEINGSVQKLIGKSVTVEGKRMGFDLIFVDHIWFDGKPWPLGIWQRIKLRLFLQMTFNTDER